MYLALGWVAGILCVFFYTYQAKNDASELYKLGIGFDLDFADSWSVNSKMLRKINKDSGHENTFMIDASLAF